MMVPIYGFGMAGDLFADRYRIVRRVGEGGMGVVFEAKDELLKKTVAIKTIRKGFIQPEHIMRFQQEAKALAALNHPNLVPLYVFGLTDDNEPYMVMRFERGTTLADMIRGRGRLPIIRALNIFIQIADAMKHAHGHGVLHRDLKPGNIMVRGALDNPEVVVLDFGVAMLEAGDAIATLTKTGMIIGTPTYMSPEQVRGKDIDARSDIYSLGCIMYETLTAKPPFTAATALELLSKKMTAEAPHINQDGEDYSFPAAIDAIVATALSADSNERYQSMAELKEELLAFKSGEYAISSSSKAGSQAKFAHRDLPLGSNKLMLIGVPIVALLLILAASSLTANVLRTPEINHASDNIENGSNTKKSDDAIANFLDHDIGPEKFCKDSLIGLSYLPSNEAVNDAFKEFAQEKACTVHIAHCNADMSTALDGIGKMVDHFAEFTTDRCPVSAQGLKAISKLPNLQFLHVRSAKLTAEGMRYLQAAPRLHYVDFEKSTFDADGLDEMLKMKKITDVYLSQVTQVDDEFVRRMAKTWPHMANLNIQRTCATAACLPTLKKMNRLIGLNINYMKLEDKDVELLSQFPHLRGLEIRGNPKLSLDTLKKLTKLKSLERLDITENPSSPVQAELKKAFLPQNVQIGVVLDKIFE